MKHKITRHQIYAEFCKRFPYMNENVIHYRPAVAQYIPELEDDIPGGILIYLKNGGKIIYISEEYEEKDTEFARLSDVIDLMETEDDITSEDIYNQIIDWLKELKDRREKEEK